MQICKLMLLYFPLDITLARDFFTTFLSSLSLVARGALVLDWDLPKLSSRVWMAVANHELWVNKRPADIHNGSLRKVDRF